MTHDVATEFENLYKEASKDIQTDIRKLQEGPYDGLNQVISFFQFRPLMAMGCIFVCFVLLALLGGFLLGSRPLLANIILLSALIFNFTGIVFIQALSGRMLRHVPATLRWQMTAERMIEEWDKKGINCSLIAAGKLRIFYLELLERFCVGLLGIITLVFTLERKLLGTDAIIPFPIFGFSSAKVEFLIVFNAVLLSYFLFLYAPLGWRKQVLFCLENNK